MNKAKIAAEKAITELLEHAEGDVATFLAEYLQMCRRPNRHSMKEIENFRETMYNRFPPELINQLCTKARIAL